MKKVGKHFQIMLSALSGSSGNERIRIDFDQIEAILFTEQTDGGFLFIGAGVFQSLFFTAGIPAVGNDFISFFKRRIRKLFHK